MEPTPKMKAVAAAGAGATLIAFLTSLFGVDLPDYVVVAIGGLLQFAFGYMTGETDTPGRHEVIEEDSSVEEG